MKIILSLILIMFLTVNVYANKAVFFYDKDNKVVNVWENQGQGKLPYTIKEMKKKLKLENCNAIIAEYKQLKDKKITSMFIDTNGEVVYNYKDIDRFHFDLQACEGDLFTAFEANLQFPLYYSPIARCLNYLTYPYKDEKSVSALNTLSKYLNNLVTNKIFKDSDVELFKQVLSKYRINIGGE